MPDGQTDNLEQEYCSGSFKRRLIFTCAVMVVWSAVLLVLYFAGKR